MPARVLIPFLLAFALTACAPPPRAATRADAPSQAPNQSPPAPSTLHRYQFARLCMGVKAEVTLFAADQDTASAAAAIAFDRLAQIDDALSDYRPTSELNRCCDAFADSTRTEPFRLGPDLAAVLHAARQIAELTDGAFDPTIQPLVVLWRRARDTQRLPDAASLDDARARVGWRRLHLNGPLARLDAAVRLDLGGIAKGYAASEAVATLRRRGINHCMVALAGDIAVADAPPDEPGWRIAVETGARTSAPPRPRVLLLRNQAVSTSGVSEQFIEIAGTRYAHIVDPRTGLGITRRIGATVVAPRGEITDALATAATVDPDLAWKWAQSLPLVAILLEESDDWGIRQAGYGQLPWADRTSP